MQAAWNDQVEETESKFLLALDLLSLKAKKSYDTDKCRLNMAHSVHQHQSLINHESYSVLSQL